MVFSAVDHMDVTASWSEARALACNINGERVILPTDVVGPGGGVWGLMGPRCMHEWL